MRVEFNQGVPPGCVKWLQEHVGHGNRGTSEDFVARYVDGPEFDWFYERIKVPHPPFAFGDDPFKYVPTITVKDPKLAVIFALRWS